jgi:hypothetical protein
LVHAKLERRQYVTAQSQDGIAKTLPFSENVELGTGKGPLGKSR